MSYTQWTGHFVYPMVNKKRGMEHRNNTTDGYNQPWYLHQTYKPPMVFIDCKFVPLNMAHG
jgi:hypothetical protein